MDADTAAALKLWVVTNRALHAVGDRLSRHLAEVGLTPTEFGVLEVLYARGSLPLGEVASRVLLQCGSLTYVVKKLEGEGLVLRRPSGEDRRVVLGELTDAGRALMDEVFPAHAAVIASAMSAASVDEKRAAAEALKRIGLHAAAME